jgi:hypothetical protein
VEAAKRQRLAAAIDRLSNQDVVLRPELDLTVTANAKI